jgi:Chain length determinant protein
MAHMGTHSGAAAALREVLRRWPVVLAVTLAALAAAAIALSQQEDSYTAAVRLVVTPLAQQDDAFLGTSLVRDAGDAARTTSTVAETMDSQRVYAETAGRMGDGWTAAEVADAVDVKPVAESNLVEVSAEASGRAEASGLATTFVDASLDLRWRTIAGQIRDRIATLDALPDADDVRHNRQLLAATLSSGADPTLTLKADEPRVSAQGISTAAVIALALVGGLFLGALAALGMSRLGGRVRSEGDVLASYPLPILARALPESMLQSAKVLPDLAWQGVFGGLAARIASALTDGGTILVTSPSDGDGRSASATSLAAAFTDGARLATLVELRLGAPAQEEVAEMLGTARARAPFVVVDAPPLGGEPRALKAAALADVVLIVVRVGHTDRQALRRARELLEVAGVKPAGVVLIGPVADGADFTPEVQDQTVAAPREPITLNR